VGGSSPRPLATLFGAEQEGRRGPTLGSAILRDPEASQGSGWRLMLVGPLRVQLFDAYTGQPIHLEDASVMSAINAHVPFTSCCMGEEAASSTASPSRYSTTATQLALGCQDGVVLVFSLTSGSLSGPLYELKVDGEQSQQMGAESESPEALPPSGGSCLAMSVTTLRISGTGLYAGACGRCRLWDLRSGELRREFHLPGGSDRLVTPGALCVVDGVRRDGGAEEVTQLWIGLDNGGIAVFDVQSGVLVRSFSTGPEAVVSLALFCANSFVFALSAHRRVSVWDAVTYSFMQKYPAELITCGADLSAMVAADVPSANAETPEMALLLLAGVDGSLCVRRVGRRQDGKLHCVLMCYLENVSGNPGCPITSINYHAATDSVLLGDAGYTVSLLSPLQEQLGNTSSAEIPRLKPGQSGTPSSSPTPAVEEPQSANSNSSGREQSHDIEVGDEKSAIDAVVPDNASQSAEVAESSSPFPVFSGS